MVLPLPAMTDFTGYFYCCRLPIIQGHTLSIHDKDNRTVQHVVSRRSEAKWRKLFLGSGAFGSRLAMLAGGYSATINRLNYQTYHVHALL